MSQSSERPPTDAPDELEKAAADAAADDAASAGAPAEPEPLPLDLVSPQFTVRAVLTGMVLAAVLSACNVYAGLRIGWGFNMSIVAALLSYGFWQGLSKLTGGFVRPWGILENNINQTAASSGASVSSAGLVAPVPALAMLTGQTLSWHWLALWVFSVMMVGITVAIGVRRQMLLRDKLPFPSGVASAETLKEMYAHGKEAMARVLMLVAGGIAAAIVKTMEMAEHSFGITTFSGVKAWPLPGAIKGFSLKNLTMQLEPSLLFYAAGALIGLRAGISLAIGAVLAYVVIAPPMMDQNLMRLTTQESLAALPAGVELSPPPDGYLEYEARSARLKFHGVMSDEELAEYRALSDDAAYVAAIETLHKASQLRQDPATATGYAPATPSFGQMTKWLLWPGVTLMVISGLVSFSFSWRSVLATATGFRAGSTEDEPPSTEQTSEVGMRMFVAALVAALIVSTIMQWNFFEIALWLAVLGVLMSFVFALVAARVSGETNITPVGAMGKVTQLMFGVLAPGQVAPNLMAANVTGGAASQCADLLHDMKCGYLIGASPKWQSLAQMFGALAGALAGSAIYLVLIPNPNEQLLTTEWAAPAVAAWKAVAELFKVGLQALPVGASTAMIYAAIAGVALPILERIVPKKRRIFVPSAASIGIAFVVPAQYSLTMFLGAVLGWIVTINFKSWSNRFLIVLAAGMVAGDTLMGFSLSLIDLVPQMWETIFGK